MNSFFVKTFHRNRKKEALAFVKGNEILLSIIQMIAASWLLALCAQIKIPLFFTPVPITLQTFAAMLIGITLGARKGTFSVLFYLLQGSIGLPMFAGGNFGFMYLMGPTGGYLIGCLLQTYIAGCLLNNNRTHSLAKIFTSLLLSVCVQLGLGALWLSNYVGSDSAFMMGVFPFITGEIAKILTLCGLVKYQCGQQTQA